LMEGVALRLCHDVLGQLVAEHLATAAIILGRRRDESWARPGRASAVLRTRD
jgi:hypothetical protein